ncbi:MAG: hypothetical protein QXX12_00440 [Nanopusillaceae archaeon]
MSNPYKALASAVILQWMTDYQELIRKLRLWPNYPLTEEEKTTLYWTETEWCTFWCEVAEISKDKLLEWQEKIKGQKLHVLPSVKRGGLNLLNQKEEENDRKNGVSHQNKVHRACVRKSTWQGFACGEVYSKQTSQRDRKAGEEDSKDKRL